MKKLFIVLMLLVATSSFGYDWKARDVWNIVEPKLPDIYLSKSNVSLWFNDDRSVNIYDFQNSCYAKITKEEVLVMLGFLSENIEIEEKDEYENTSNQ